MEVFVESDDREREDEVYRELLTELGHLEPDLAKVTLRYDSNIQVTAGEIRKGDPGTIYSVLIALVASGGALTVAVSKHGFLTKLTEVLRSYSTKSTRIKVVTKKGEETYIEGPAESIERILLAAFEVDNEK
jgi:hypothetical protein